MLKEKGGLITFTSPLTEVGLLKRGSLEDLQSIILFFYHNLTYKAWGTKKISGLGPT